MPELPEIEVLRRGLATDLCGQVVRSCTLKRLTLRWPIPADLPYLLEGKAIQKLGRRGKYLLWHFDHGMLLIHLGMSGTLQFVLPESEWTKHDHLQWIIGNRVLRLNDPRRFGAVLWSNTHDHPLLAHLGIEPFDPAFTSDSLRQSLQTYRSDIKSVLLAGKAVVGVGNIYASEALFLAGIDPRRAANRISAARIATLQQAIIQTLEKAIAAGGSSIRDFLNAEGTKGYFQQQYAVYGRTAEPCRRCQSPIRKIIQGQRASFFCARCQR